MERCELIEALKKYSKQAFGERTDSIGEVLKEAAEMLSQDEYTILGVMHFVDKWLDGDELEQDEVVRACTMREKTLEIVEELQAENKKLNANSKVGTWEEIKEGAGLFEYHFRCTKCGGETPSGAYPVAPDFCPCCGNKKV